MVTRKEVVAFIDESGAVTVNQLCEKFGMDKSRARQAVIKLLDAGLLIWCPALPRQAVFFTTPKEGRAFGLILRQKAGHGGSTGISRDKYYGPHMEGIRKLIKARSMGVTISEVVKELEVTRVVATKALDMLVEKGELWREAATGGGPYGRPPWIYAASDDDYEARDEQYQEERKTRTKKKAEPKEPSDIPELGGWS